MPRKKHRPKQIVMRGRTRLLGKSKYYEATWRSSGSWTGTPKRLNPMKEACGCRRTSELGMASRCSISLDRAALAISSRRPQKSAASSGGRPVQTRERQSYDWQGIAFKRSGASAARGWACDDRRQIRPAGPFSPETISRPARQSVVLLELELDRHHQFDHAPGDTWRRPRQRLRALNQVERFLIQIGKARALLQAEGEHLALPIHREP